MYQDVSFSNASYAITEGDFRFDQVVTGMRSFGGLLIEETGPIGMPKINRRVLDCIGFLYPSVEDAESGSQFGGTGFCIGVPVPGFEKNYIVRYFVTNWHVAVSGGHSVIRVNTPTGVAIVDLDPSQWCFIPGGSDLAAIPIYVDCSFLPSEMLLGDEHVARFEVGPGDDTFMIGRFADLQGDTKNKPALRFGHISIDPTPMRVSTGGTVDAYCVDTNSRTGFSGSPVFVYRTVGQNLDHVSHGGVFNDGRQSFWFLLGVHFAQFPEQWEADGQINDPVWKNEAKGPAFKARVNGLSGMTCVAPAWQVRELLDLQRFKDHRQQLADQLATQPLP